MEDVPSTGACTQDGFQIFQWHPHRFERPRLQRSAPPCEAWRHVCHGGAAAMAVLLGEGFGCVEKGKETTENSWSWRILELIVVVCVYRCFLGVFFGR